MRRVLAGLQVLAEETDSPAVRWLLDHGAEIDDDDDSGHTPLHTAAEHDALNAARDLIATGAAVRRPNTYYEHPISAASSTAMLQLLADAGAEIDFVDGCGDWPLKLAAAANDTERVSWLLARGAKVENTSTGETAPHAAVRTDAREALDLLLAAGANPNAQDVDGWTAFFCACSREAIHRLRRAGGDPTIRDDVGGQPSGWLKDRLLRYALTEPLP